MNINGITLGEFGGAIAFLVALFSGLAYILKPVTNFRGKQRETDERIKKIEEHQDNNNKRLELLEEDTKQILLSVSTLLNHSIDNNHVEQLKKRKSDLEAYLIER